MSVLIEIAPLAVSISGAIVGTLYVFLDFAKENWRKRFRQQLKAAVAREALTYTDLQHISERWGQDRKAVLQALRILLSESVAGEDSTLTDKTEFVRHLLGEHQSREPYAELPENISLQLAAMSPALAQQPSAVPQLAASLGDLYTKNQQEITRQKKLAVWGFVVGVLGLVASLPGIYAMFKT